MTPSNYTPPTLRRASNLQSLTTPRFGTKLLWGSLLVLKLMVVGLVVTVGYLVFRPNPEAKRVESEIGELRGVVQKFSEASTRQSEAATKQADAASKQAVSIQQSIATLAQQSSDQLKKMKGQEDRRYQEIKAQLAAEQSEIAGLRKEVEGSAQARVSGTLTVGSGASLKPCSRAIPVAAGKWDVPIVDARGNVSRYERITPVGQEIDPHADQVLMRITRERDGRAYLMGPNCDWRSIQ